MIPLIREPPSFTTPPDDDGEAWCEARAEYYRGRNPDMTEAQIDWLVERDWAKLDGVERGMGEEEG